MRIAALDIGGANIKAYVSSSGDAPGPEGALTWPFALWKYPDKLTDQLETCLRALAPLEHLSVTLTGELCDAYRTKREGVRAILESVRTAATRGLTFEAGVGARSIEVWRNDGTWKDLEEAMDDPLPCAAANWLALATYAGRWAPLGDALLLDIGSTTTDIILLCDGRPLPLGRTDPTRLQSGELVYTGVERTPIAAVVDKLPFGDGLCPVAAEFFATTRDAYILLGKLNEEPTDTDTADGRPANRSYAHERLARMVCADSEIFDPRDAESAARYILEHQMALLRTQAERVLERSVDTLEAVIVSGSGEFLAQQVAAQLQAPVVSFEHHHGPQVSRVATAFALQQLSLEKVTP